MREWAVLGVKLLGISLAAEALAYAGRTIVTIVDLDPSQLLRFDIKGPELFGFFVGPLSYLLPAFILTRYTDFCLRVAGFPERRDEPPGEVDG